MIRNLVLAGAALLFSAPAWGQAFVSGGVSVVLGRPAPVYYPQPAVPVLVRPVPVPYRAVAPACRIPPGHWRRAKRVYYVPAPAFHGRRW